MNSIFYIISRNIINNKLKYLSKDFNSLSIKIEKKLWENKDEPMEACLQSVACRLSAVSTQTKCRVKQPYMLENKKRSLLIFLFDDLWAKFAKGV